MKKINFLLIIALCLVLASCNVDVSMKDDKDTKNLNPVYSYYSGDWTLIFEHQPTTISYSQERGIITYDDKAIILVDGKVPLGRNRYPVTVTDESLIINQDGSIIIFTA